MSTVIGIDLAGRGVCTATCDEHRDVVSAITQRSPGEMVLPLHAREPLLTLAASAQHRRGSGLLWPPEAQVPVLGDARNGRGRRYLAELLDRMASDGALIDVTATYETAVSWRPDGQTTVDVPAEKLVAAATLGLAQARAGRSSHHAMIGMVVPEELPLHGQQLILDALGGAENVMLVPAAVAAAAAWCFEGDGKDNRQQTTADKRLYVGYIDVVDLGLGRWGVARFAIYCVRKGPRTYLVPLRAKENRHYPDAKSTGLSWLSGQAPAGRGQPSFDGVFPGPGLSERLDGKCTVELGAAGRALRDALKKLRAATDSFVAPEKKGWGASLGTLLTGGLEQVKTDAGEFIKLVQDCFPDASPQPLEAASRAAAWIAGGRLHDWPTWLERLEPLDLRCVGTDELGDSVERWIPLGGQDAIDAGKMLVVSDLIDGLSIQARTRELAVYFRQVRGASTTFKLASFIVEERPVLTPIRLEMRARPGQGFAIIDMFARETDAFLARLDWTAMRVVENPPEILYGYIPHVVEHRYHSSFESLGETAIAEMLEALEQDAGPVRLANCADALRSALAKYRSARQMQIPGQGDNPFLYYSLVPLELNETMNGETCRALRKIAKEINRISGELARQRGKDNRQSQKMDRMLGWLYRSCPVEVIQRRWIDVPSMPEVAKTDLDVVGLAMHEQIWVSDFINQSLNYMPRVDKANNWLRCIRNLVRYNQHALRDCDEDKLNAGVDDITRRLTSALAINKPMILRNCLETLVYLLKRRRYSAEFLAIGSERHANVKRVIKQSINQGAVNRTVLRTAELALKFIDRQATTGDITLSAQDASDDAGDDEED